MKETQKDVNSVQGTLTQEEVKTRKIAPLHAIKSYNGAVDRLLEAKLVNIEDGEKLKGIGEKMIKQYLGLEMFK